MYGKKSASSGIVDVYIDASKEASFDQYAAVPSANVKFTQAGIIVAAAGLKTLKFTMDSKNASSSHYKLQVTTISLWRTA